MDATNKPVRTAEDRANCEVVTDMLGRIGDKWTVRVVGALSAGTLRYTDLQRSVRGISQRMLTLTLRGLEEDGLVVRTIHPSVPPRVEYTLTPMGHSLTAPLSAMFEWTVEHRPAVMEARKAYAKATAKKAG